MSGQAAQLAPPSSPSRYRAVEFLYEEFHTTGLAAIEALLSGNSQRFAAAMKTEIHLVATLLESLSYNKNPTLSAYLKGVFDYVITQLVIGKGAQSRAAIDRALCAMDELHGAFLAAHRANP
jgi:flagellin-specific chaperone FliS